MLDAPVRIFRCPICVENHIKAPLQDLSVLVEHLAKHLNFYLFECRRCKDRFATPFIANFHVKEGKCSTVSGKDKEEPLKSVNLNDVDFSSFCHLQNIVTKCTKQMLYEQNKRIRQCFKRSREWSMAQEECPSGSFSCLESSGCSKHEPPKKRPSLENESFNNSRKCPESQESCTVDNCQNPQAEPAHHMKQIFGVEPSRLENRPSIFSKPLRYQESGSSEPFHNFHNYGSGFSSFGENNSGPNKKLSWFYDEKQASTSKLPSVSSMLWRDSKAESP